MARLFGTDGVRGIANEFLTCEMAMQLGRAACEIVKDKEAHPVFVIGKDGRISGDMLEEALCAGIMAQGGDVIKLGVSPTPAVAMITRALKASAGVVISASHNPYDHNGIKFFSREGLKLPDEVEDSIEKMMKSDIKACDKDAIGRAKEDRESINHYTDFILSCADDDFNGWKIVVDCANGATVEVAKRVFAGLKADVIFIGDNNDGFNINKNYGSTHLNTLKEAVKKHQADAGIAFDGDGDRILMTDEEGKEIDGDKIMYLLAKDMKEQGKLLNNNVVATVMSNLGFLRALEQEGIGTMITQVGDRYVIEEMLKHDYVLGGEQSGHVIIKDYNSTGDGLLTAMRLLSAVKRSGQTFGQCNASYENYPQILVNVQVSNEKKKEFQSDQVIADAVKKAEEELKDTGRVLLRPSGTEALIRVMIEGRDFEQISRLTQQLAEIVEERLG